MCIRDRTGDQRLRLRGDGLAQRRVAVAEHGHALRRSHVQVAAAGGVEQPAALAAGDDGVVAPRGGAAEVGFFELSEGASRISLR